MIAAALWLAWAALVAVITLDAHARGVATDLVVIGAVALLATPTVLARLAEAEYARTEADR
jgi:hypothetical protein